ncbi:MAG: DUF4450 domain-containing protein [Bacteroidota bacterium]|nr:DUF4450 domain-containing protein [Bacteroidota bacterium]
MKINNGFKIFLFLIATSLSLTGFTQSSVNYVVENGAIVGRNTGRYNNRPLYINNSNAFILAGDQPIARLAKDQYLYGTLMLAIERNGKNKWLQQCDQITSLYHAGQMCWLITDAAFPGLKIKLEVLPMAQTTGMVVCASAEGAKPGDKLIWTFGGAQWRKDQNLSWKLDVLGQPELLNWGFVPEECKNNQVNINGEAGFLSLKDNETDKRLFTVAVSCNSLAKTGVSDASDWNDFTLFNQSKPNQLPIMKGTVVLENAQSSYWAIEAFNQDVPPDISRINNPEKAFHDGVSRIEELRSHIKLNTPDSYLNAMAQASTVAIDGAWHAPVFHHGAMQWNVRLPGWRTIFGGTMLGWHDRVKAEAKFYIESQIKESTKTKQESDTLKLFTKEGKGSRFYGVGYISRDQDFYNMQTQFFDQIIEEWRWTADPELESLLRQALELHLKWQQDCFDPDGDGVYESYLNTWPTDSQWYNGGGTAEETSYAYRGHLAARDLARRAKDVDAENFHNQMMAKIKKGFFEKLWIPERGYSGSYREQGGYERLHTDPWLYSIFLPIDSKLTNDLQSIESTYYSEWALQNDKNPLGGRKVWTSNWIPGIWSVRELWPGDNYHLALSYFQAGLPDDGYDILRGTYMCSGFGSVVPGNLGDPAGGIDFGDCMHPFVRTIVQGLFGFNPDLPNGIVNFNPQFPSDWNQASIEIPDVKINFNQSDKQIKYNIELIHPVRFMANIPFSSLKVNSVTVNGKAVKWTVLPSAGRSLLQLNILNTEKAEIVINTSEELAFQKPIFVEGNIGEPIQLPVKDAKVMEVYDSQKVLEKYTVSKNTIQAKLGMNKGSHTVIAKVLVGENPQYRVFRLKINDPQGDAAYAAKFLDQVPATVQWNLIDISKFLNADVREIYRQKYLSPRPKTVSARIGTDGYSAWTFPHWGAKAPEINLDKVANYKVSGQIVTPQKVPFRWNDDSKNIAFTSLWDNFPHGITVPVKQKGDAIWMLIAGSTNIMQCQITNAVIRLNYADGKTDSLELVPPVNYWSLSTIYSHPQSPGSSLRNYYFAEKDKFCLPKKLPETVELGQNCRAMVLNLKLRPGVELESVTLETLSQEVVVGLMGVTIMTLK